MVFNHKRAYFLASKFWIFFHFSAASLIDGKITNGGVGILTVVSSLFTLLKVLADAVKCHSHQS